MARPTVLFPVTDGKKICSVCRVPQETTAFYRNAQAKTGLQPGCKKCCKRYESGRSETRRNRPGYHDKNHEYHLVRDFNMTKERYVEILRAQGGRCAICRTDKPGGAYISEWAVDHDHRCCPGKKSCGKCVRGLLCRACNLGIGSLRDDPEIVYASLCYLVEHGPSLIGDINVILTKKVA